MKGASSIQAETIGWVWPHWGTEQRATLNIIKDASSIEVETRVGRVALGN
jgi:hypothetical protein